MSTRRQGSLAGTPLLKAKAPAPAPADATGRTVEVPQYGVRSIVAVWAGAALPMGALAWLVAPAVADGLSGADEVPMAKALFGCLTAGLAWQFVLVVVLVAREQRSLRWAVLREALWLGAPRSPRTGRIGGWNWLVIVPLIVLLAAAGLIPGPPIPADRDVAFLGTQTGESFLSGNWVWFAVIVTMLALNTVLGEELLFRGFLLPRMNGVFGRADWVANGVLFATYHIHVPWMIPVSLLDTFLLAYPTKRYRCAWIGIAVHSAQSVFFLGMVLLLVT